MTWLLPLHLDKRVARVGKLVAEFDSDRESRGSMPRELEATEPVVVGFPAERISVTPPWMRRARYAPP